MKIAIALSGLLTLLSAPAGWGQSGAGQDSAAAPAQSAETVVAGWPRASRAIARAMIEEYGQPAEISADAALWRNNGPWKRTIVYRAPPANWSSRSDADVLQQVVSYRVPLEKFAELAIFDTRLTADRTRRELSFRSESEALNFLALNLAHDIITGEKDAKTAQAAFAKASELMKAGKSSPDTEGLRFQDQKPRLTVPY